MVVSQAHSIVHLFPTFRFRPIGLVPPKHSRKKNIRTVFRLSFPRAGVTSIYYFISKEDHDLHYRLQQTMQSQAFKASDKNISLPKPTSNLPFDSFLLNPKITNYFASVGKAEFTMKVLPFGLYGAHLTFLISFRSDAFE